MLLGITYTWSQVEYHTRTVLLGATSTNFSTTQLFSYASNTCLTRFKMWLLAVHVHNYALVNCKITLKVQHSYLCSLRYKWGWKYHELSTDSFNYVIYDYVQPVKLIEWSHNMPTIINTHAVVGHKGGQRLVRDACTVATAVGKKVQLGVKRRWTVRKSSR